MLKLPLVGIALSVVVTFGGCTPAAEPPPPTPIVQEAAMPSDRQDFANRYAEAWSSQNAVSVASFFSEAGSLKINDGAPSVGREAITASAQGFMTAFPDLRVTNDRTHDEGDRTIFEWTLTGKNTGPGGTGAPVKISGRESWKFGADGLVAESIGSFDSADYERQLAKTP